MDYSKYLYYLDGDGDVARKERQVGGSKRKSSGRKAAAPKKAAKSSAKKRFRVRPGGTVKRGQAFKRHILTKKTTKNKRQLRGTMHVHDTNVDSVKAMLPYA